MLTSACDEADGSLEGTIVIDGESRSVSLEMEVISFPFQFLFTTLEPFENIDISLTHQRPGEAQLGPVELTTAFTSSVSVGFQQNLENVTYSWRASSGVVYLDQLPFSGPLEYIARFENIRSTSDLTGGVVVEIPEATLNVKVPTEDLESALGL